MTVSLSHYFRGSLKLQDTVVAAFILGMISLVAFLNVYTMGSSPVWDGALYNTIISDFVAGGYSLRALNFHNIGNSQLGASAANRIFYFYTVAGAHRVTGVDLKYIYPALNLICGFLTSFFLYKLCTNSFKLTFASSVGAGIWFSLSPCVLLVNQALAHPELLMTAFVAMGYYNYTMGRLKLGAVLLFLAVLSKQTAVLASAFVIVDIAFSTTAKRLKLRRMLLYVGAMLSALLVPLVFIDNSQFSFKASVIESILRGLNGHLFQDVLFNFDVLWVLIIAGLPLFERSFQLNIVILMFLSMMMSVIGSTDWFRTFFSILFFVLLPIAAKTIDFVTSSRHMPVARALLVTCFAIMLIKPKPYLNFDYVRNPAMESYVFAAFLVLICYAANLMRRPEDFRGE